MSKITLRKKAISGNRQSLYLDIYPPIPHPVTGKLTRRDFLGLYIFDKPKTPLDKDTNKETLLLAENIKAKRQLELQKGNYGFLAPKKVNIEFEELFLSIASKFKAHRSTYWIWTGALKHLKDFSKGEVYFSMINENFCEDFKQYLLKTIKKKNGEPLSQNSARGYFNKFNQTLNEALKLKIIQTNINIHTKAIPINETHREYFSYAELQILANTECPNPLIKKAGLFSVLTGLRFSDIQKLLWSEIQFNNLEGYSINFRQKKTKGIESLPISEQAFNLLGEPKPDELFVFKGLVRHGQFYRDLKAWIKATGITRRITFHAFRHTFATLQLSLGTDIYTVSKMLGHRELRTTQIYAKVIDKSKREAANKIVLEF